MLKPLIKIVLVPLRLTAAAPTVGSEIHKKVSSNEINRIHIKVIRDIMGIVKSLKDTGLLIKDENKLIKTETLEQRERLFGIMLGTLGANLLRNILAGKGMIRADDGEVRGLLKTGFLMLLFPMTNIEMQKYYQSKPKFKGVYLPNNLPNTEDGVFGVNLDEYKLIGTYWIALHTNDNSVHTLIFLMLNKI